MRNDRATIRIDAATGRADVFFRLTPSRGFERVGGPNPEARLTARSSTAGSRLAGAIPEGGPRHDDGKIRGASLPRRSVVQWLVGG